MVGGDGAEAGGDLTPAVKRKPVNGRVKGAKYELDLAAYFVSLGYENARRMIRTGTVKHADEGDLDGLPFTVQAKTQKTEAGDAQIGRWLASARTQAKVQGHLLGLLIVKRNGHGDIGKSWVYLDALSLTRLGNPGMHLPAYEVAQAGWSTTVRVSLEQLARLLVISYPRS